MRGVFEGGRNNLSEAILEIKLKQNLPVEQISIKTFECRRTISINSDSNDADDLVRRVDDEDGDDDDDDDERVKESIHNIDRYNQQSLFDDFEEFFHHFDYDDDGYDFDDDDDDDDDDDEDDDDDTSLLLGDRYRNHHRNHLQD
ncbi:hypothetical protein QR98_0101690 [Sarcoptes scabiei]|uniref:Uncharacterized protein n=1 Tax=Sarcoptes scabiei TaxID=52283 RepID=A0A132AKT3_SARSC|nr:hypothetical protein QR98_0101690 [Sarcoptes scabiei]